MVSNKLLNDFLQVELDDLTKQNLLRKPQIISRKLVDFSSNDYLGLASQRLSEIGLDMDCGIGSSGARLTTGTHDIHVLVEAMLADWKQREEAMLFGSGYLVNLGVIPALVNTRDIVFGDELNHACINDGIRLSKARRFNYMHNDMQDLERLLLSHRHKYDKAMIITDTVFSMDGDIAHLREISNLAQKYNCFTYVDEAHATGVFGLSGAGLVEELKLENSIDIQIGTCSKALGLEGAYIVGSKELISFLRNKARTYMFSTASSPVILELLKHNINELRNNINLRKKLQSNIQLLRDQFQKFQILNYINDHSAIFTLFFSDISSSLEASSRLKERGFNVMAIRPPTVKTPRLRICVSAKHNEIDIINLAQAIKEIINETS